MCRKCNRTKEILILTTILVTFLSFSVLADELTLEQTFQQGIAKNSELMEQRDELRGAELSLKQIAAGLNWQVDLSGNIGYNKINEKNYTGVLLINKHYFSGLTVGSQLSLSENEPFRFNDLNDKYSLSIDLTQEIYPVVPDAKEEQYYQLENQLKVMKLQYANLLKTREIDWLELYLNLRSVKKSMKLAEEGYRLAEKNLAAIQAREEIGEAGKVQLLAARIGLKEAELHLKKTRNSYQQSADRFYQALGISDRQTRIVAVDEYLEQVKKRIASAGLDYYDLEALMELVKQNNTQIKGQKINQDYKEQELRWLEAAGKPRLSATGNYNHNPGGFGEDGWQVGIGVNYNLFDSGRQQASLEKKERELSSLERQYNSLIEDLKIGLRELINQLKYDQLDLENNQLTLKKADLEVQLAEEQLKEGLLTNHEYRQKLNVRKEAGISLETARGRILIDKLRILNFVGK